MSDSKTIAALEIGTGKMQVFIGEIVDNKMLNWTAIFTSLSNPNFSFDDSSMAEILLREAKRIRDMDKMNGMSK